MVHEPTVIEWSVVGLQDISLSDASAVVSTSSLGQFILNVLRCQLIMLTRLDVHGYVLTARKRGLIFGKYVFSFYNKNMNE